MKAISIRQPWAWAIMNVGKDIENRKWFTSHRGPILIHASKGCTQAEFKHFFFWWRDEFPHDPLANIKLPPQLDDLPRGGIVGIADLVDCVSESSSPWFFGKFGFVLDKVEPVDFYPCQGQLGIFDIDYTPMCKNTEDMFAE